MRLVLRCFMMVMAVALVPQAAQAATYYVALNGSDSNPGTQAQPFQTIAKGLSVMGAGDTLYLRAGSYASGINDSPMTMPSGTSWSNASQIAAFPGETVVVVGLPMTSAHYVIFDGLIVDTSGLPGEGIWWSGTSHHLRFINGEVRNATSQGVLLTGSSDSHEVINSKIHHNGNRPLYDHGFYIETGNHLIEKNDIYLNATFGVQVQGASASNNIVRKNLIHDNNTAGYGVGGIFLHQGVNNLVYDNVIWNNTEQGIEIYSGNNQQVYNNTLYNHSDFGVRATYATNSLVKNNISDGANIRDYQTGNGTIFSNNLCSISGGGCSLVTNPLFVNPAANDFRLQSTSPAINAGVSLSQVPDDVTGTPRPQGAAYDIGAYEFAQAGGAATKLAFTTQPQGTGVGTTLAPVVVQAQDAGNLLDATYTGTISLALTGCAGPLTGTTSKAATAGQATYTDLAVSSAGTCQLQATAAGLTAATSTAFAIIGQALIASYQFENVVTDSSGFGNNAVLTGGPTYTASLSGHGQALSLNGTTQYASAPDAASLDTTAAVSIAAWVNPSVPMTTWKAVVSKSLAYYLYASSDASGGCGAGGVVGGFVDTTTTTDRYVCAAPLSANTWVHLAMTYNGTILRLYVNGSQVGTTTITATIANSANTLQIGSSTFNEFFAGLIDDVNVYNYAISAAQVAGLASLPLSPATRLRVIR